MFRRRLPPPTKPCRPVSGPRLRIWRKWNTKVSHLTNLNALTATSIATATMVKLAAIGRYSSSRKLPKTRVFRYMFTSSSWQPTIVPYNEQVLTLALQMQRRVSSTGQLQTSFSFSNIHSKRHHTPGVLEVTIRS